MDRPAIIPEVVEPIAAVKPAALSGFGKVTGPLAAATGTAGTHAPLSSLSSPLPLYPASPAATPASPQFVIPLFTPSPLFFPNFSLPVVPEVIPTALSDSLEGLDSEIKTAQGQLRPPHLPAHLAVFRYEEAVCCCQQAEATFQYLRSALAFAIKQENQARRAMDVVIDGAADKAAKGSCCK